MMIIDSNNAANNTSAYRIDTSANWTSSANVSGYWNTGYWVAPTAAVSDPARFQFLASTPGCYTVDAWWTAAADRSTAAPWIAYDATGAEVGRAVVDQSTRGSQWNTLGTWGFTTGWNQVDLSRWASSGAVVVADAVRLTPAACTTNLHITSVSPVRPGQPLTVSVEGAAPGAALTIYTGSGRGTSGVPGCATGTLPFAPVSTLVRGTADGAGRATLRVTSPTYLTSKVFRFVAVDTGSCAQSPALRQRF